MSIERLLQLAKLVRRLLYVGVINVLIFMALFSLAELSVRVYREGLTTAFFNLTHYFRSVPYSNLGTGNWVIYDERLGYRLNPQKSGINRISVRHRDIITPKPQGLYRILVLGDSIPWDKPGFVDYMEQMLSKEGNFEVINAAVPGYTAYQELLFFKTYLQHTEPDLVIWTYCLNDNHRFLHRFDEKAQMLWTDEARESLRTTSFFDKLASRSYILNSLKMRILARQKQQQQSCRFPWECMTDFNIAWQDEPWARYQAYLAEMKGLTQQMHSGLAIIIFPFEPQLEQLDRTQDAEYILKPQRQLDAFCEKYDLPCLDVFPFFHKKNHNTVKLFRDGIHLSEAGHEQAATLIYDFLNEKHLLSPEGRIASRLP
jgi:lysophospholipase L1-like esterase